MTDTEEVGYRDIDGIIPYGFSFQYALRNDPSLRSLIDWYLQFFQTATSRNVLLSKNKRATHIFDIPSDCEMIIFEYMDCHSLCAAQSVCRQWETPATMDSYWQHLCITAFHSSPSSFVFKRDISIKSLYASMHVALTGLLYGKKGGEANYLFTIPVASAPLLMVHS